MKRLERKKTDAAKKKRVQHKIHRTEEQTLRYCVWETLISHAVLGQIVTAAIIIFHLI